MPKFVTPNVYWLGTTTPDVDEMKRYLIDSGNEGFIQYLDDAIADGITPEECMISMFAKLCYKSLTVGHNPNISKVRDIQDNLRSILDTAHGSILEHIQFNFLFTNVSRVFTHELVRHRIGTAFCLAGDTIIYSGSKVNGRFNGIGKSKKRTIKQIYDWSLDKKRKGHVKLMTVRCYDGERFVPAHIKSVTKSGIKKVHNVLLKDGKSIKCSLDHRFLTEDGWKALRELKIGSKLATNGKLRTGIASTPEKEAIRREKIALSKIGSNNPQWAGDDVGPNGARRRARQNKLDVCLKCGSDEKLQVHHKDRDILNNAISNLETLCASCHTKLHYQEDGSGTWLVPDFIEITSIDYIGEEETYDLEIDHEAHNFVANGIVTHNSQTSGRYVRLDEIELVLDPILEPIKEDVRIAVEYIEQHYKRLVEKSGVNDVKDFTTKKKITSALRRIAPNGLANEIAFSCNLRSIRHIILLRTARHAEWEIRKVFGDVYNLLNKRYPIMFEGAKVEVIDGLPEVSGLKMQPYEQITPNK